ncbi:transposase [Paenibacillus sp. CECT 9249]|uniref:transposase n=1 Tax=Paenibacillus sp. CECT 9249 TaxID=2845385 RepID=UPI0033BAD8E3
MRRSASRTGQGLRGRQKESFPPEKERKHRFPQKKQGSGCHLWARGYYVSTAGINKDVIREYIQKQEEADTIEDRSEKQPLLGVASNIGWRNRAFKRSKIPCPL